MKRLIFIVLGTIFLGLGLLGVVLPILPTTPFLLLTLTLYAKGSVRFETWFKQTKLYKRYLEDFVAHRAMKKRDKWMLLIFVDLVLLTTILMVQNIWVAIVLIVVDIVKYVYFMTQVKTLPSPSSREQQTKTQTQKSTLG